MTGRVLLNRAAGILIAAVLLVTPFSVLLVGGAGGAQGFEYNGGDITISSASGKPSWNIPNGVVLTGNLVIGAGGVVTVDHGAITFSQESGNEYTLVIEDGGKLILRNSTLTTRLDNLLTSIGLGVYVHNGGVLEAYDSHLRFPGHFVVEDSSLTLWRSTIEGHEIEQVRNKCDPVRFPAEYFNDAPVLLFVNSTVNLFDSHLEDIYEAPALSEPNPEMYDYSYSFVSDQHDSVGNRTATYHLDSASNIDLDTYRKVTLAGDTSLTSVNTYIGVDFSDDPFRHNSVELRDRSMAYIYGLAVDDTQEPANGYERKPAFVSIEGTYNATVADDDSWHVNQGETLIINGFDTGGSKIPIAGATLYFQYVTSPVYSGTSSVQWKTQDGSLKNTDIKITQSSEPLPPKQYDLYARGVQTIEDVKGLTIQLTNNAGTPGQVIDVDRVWIEVTTIPTVYIYRWANVTAYDSQNNLVSGAAVDATMVIPEKEPAYYHTPNGLQYAPPAEVLKYLGTDAEHFKVTGSDGTVSIPLLSESLNSSRLNPYVVYSYNLTVTRTDGSDAYCNYANVGHAPNDEGSWGQYPNLAWDGMFFPVRVNLTNLIFLPDLYVDPADITFSSNPIAGSAVTAYITVHNQGRAAAGNVTVQIYAGKRENGQLLNSTAISVDAHGSTSIQLTWVPDKIGTYPIYVHVNDIYPRALEPDYANNVAVKNIVVSINVDGSLVIGGAGNDLQDLTFIDPRDFPYNVIVQGQGRLTFEGAALRILQSGSLYKIVVKDQGQLSLRNGAVLSSTGSLDIILRDDAVLKISNGSAVAAEVKILPYDHSTIRVLELSTINSDLVAPTTSSMHLEAVNSTLNGVSLYNTSSARLTNVALSSLNLYDSATAKHYRWVQIAVVDGRGDPLPGATVTIQPLVGPAPDRSGVTGADGRIILEALANDISAAGPGDVGPYSVNVSYASGGTTYYGPDNAGVNMPSYSLGSAISKITITPKNGSGQEVPLKVAGWKPQLAPADLAVSDVRFSPSGPVQVGTKITITVDITNNGGQPSTQRLARFYLGNDLIGTATIPAGLAPEKKTSIFITWEASVPLGERDVWRTIKVVLDDAAGDLAGDNEATGDIKVQDNRPDVVIFDNIAIVRSGTATNRSAAGETVTITAQTTTGIGSPSAAGVKFAFYAINATGGETLIGVVTKDVPAGQTVPLAIEWTISNVPPGKYYIEVRANYDPDLKDPRFINENVLDNNEARVEFTVDAPDPEITLNPLTRTYLPGDRVAVRGKVVNSLTQDPLGGVKVLIDLYKDGRKINAESFTSISGSDGVFLTEVHIPEGSDGQYEIRASVDIDGKEANSNTLAVVKAASEGGAPWWLYVAILAIVSAVILIFSAYLYKYGLGRMVECGECGALIPESSKRCPKCGVEFETGTAKCSKCGAWIAASSSSCSDCGAKFITEAVEGEENEYLKNMREQYEAFVDTYREEAKRTLDKKYSDAKFPDWWKKQPTYVSFETWLSQEEDKRKIGGIACPTCGILNPRGASICHKCGSMLEAPKAPAAAAAPPVERKPELTAAPKPLRRVIRRPVDKKPAATEEKRPEEPKAEEKPEEPKAEEKKPEEAAPPVEAPSAPAAPEGPKADEEKKPEEEKPSS